MMLKALLCFQHFCSFVAMLVIVNLLIKTDSTVICVPCMLEHVYYEPFFFQNLQIWKISYVNTIRPAFSVVRQAQRPDVKNQGYHQLIEMKVCKSYYMPDAKFQSGNFSIFAVMTSQNLPLKKGMSH